MLTIVGWLWHTEKPKYDASHVKTWANMIHRHIKMDHRFVLMTDRPNDDYGALVEARPLWDDWRDLKRLRGWGENKQHCYVRLKAFSREVQAIFGRRFVSIDLDCIVLRSLDGLFNRSGDFLIVRRRNRSVYNGSMWMMTAGAREKVWTEFKGEESIAAAERFVGTDQAWLCHCLGPYERGWEQGKDGVYGWTQIRKLGSFLSSPPPDARIVFFYGAQKPWNFKELEAGRLRAKGIEERVIQRLESQYNWVSEAYH